jgi:hypothetical protein
MSTTDVAMTAHLVKPALDNDDPLIARAPGNRTTGSASTTSRFKWNGDAAGCRAA